MSGVLEGARHFSAKSLGSDSMSLGILPAGTCLVGYAGGVQEQESVGVFLYIRFSIRGIVTIRSLGSWFFSERPRDLWNAPGDRSNALLVPTIHQYLIYTLFYTKATNNTVCLSVESIVIVSGYGRAGREEGEGWGAYGLCWGLVFIYEGHSYNNPW